MFCQRVGKTPWLGASAIECWNANPGRVVKAPQLGDFAFFGPDDGNMKYGHAGIVIEEDLMACVTAIGIRFESISEWSATYAPLLGYQRWW